MLLNISIIRHLEAIFGGYIFQEKITYRAYL